MTPAGSRCVVLSSMLASMLAIAYSTNALEISLEENKGETGSVGFVEIERVFKEYPETLRAKEDFQAQIRKKEKLLNEKKSGIFALKAGINKLRQEKEFAEHFPMKLEPAPIKGEEVDSDLQSGGVGEISTSTAAGVEASTSTPREQSAGLPSASGEGLPVPDKSSDAGLPLPDISKDGGLAAGVEVSTVSKDTDTVFDMPGIKSVQAAEIDSAIREKEDELAEKEAEFKGLQRQVERELLDYESQRTQIILGRIYQVMRELALAEGISVVVDKRSILYGQSAVDLTDKLIKKLRGF